MTDKSKRQDPEEELFDGGDPFPVPTRRNAIIPLQLRFRGEGDDEVQVNRPRTNTQKDQAAATDAESATAAAKSLSAAVSAEEEQQKEDEFKDPAQQIDQRDTMHYIRVGRRTIEDDDGDIPTQSIVVAKIDTTKPKITWLSVATWQLNGLRIGTIGSGDRIREDDEIFSYVVGLNVDPFFVARNAGSPNGIRKLLLERLERGEVGVQEETLEDDVARRERGEAQDSRLLAQHGPKVIYGGDKAVRAVAARGDVRLRFPHPWSLPTALMRSTACFPVGLEGFSSVASDVSINSIDVVATFANEVDDGRDLWLAHFMQVAFEPDETLESAKHYFLQGDESMRFHGLEKNEFLARKWWLLELWVLPHSKGCSVLYKWDDTPELKAREFCDTKAFEGGGDVEPKLYVEVRIVQDPDHLGGESEEGVVSEEDET